MKKMVAFILVITFSLTMLGCSSEINSSVISTSNTDNDDAVNEFAGELTESITFDGLTFKVSPDWLSDTYNPMIHHPEKTGIQARQYYPNKAKDFRIVVETYFEGETESMEKYVEEIHPNTTVLHPKNYAVVEKWKDGPITYTLYDRRGYDYRISYLFGYSPKDGHGFVIEFTQGYENGPTQKSIFLNLEMVVAFGKTIQYNPAVTERQESAA